MPGPFDELEKEAENLERKSKNEFNKKNFVPAISLLEEAKDIYNKLGYQGKIGMINQRIARLNNLVKYKKQDSDIKTKGEQEFEKRVDEVLKEKERFQEKIDNAQRALSPEVKRKIEKISLLFEKAEKEEKMGKFSRVIGRYEYIIELYKSIPKEIQDFSQQVYEIEKKISVLNTKK
ncbi:MAG: hypothetical protein ACXABO_20575 [Promethearchaeota archaeon]|jgi:hypothetical protein